MSAPSPPTGEASATDTSSQTGSQPPAATFTPASDAAGPTGNATAPTGDAAAPTSDAAAPTSDAAAPTGDAAAPPSDVTGKAAEPSDSRPPPSPGTPCATTWYRDCDADGYAGGVGGSVRSCGLPQPASNCATWTEVEPTSGKADCNDANPEYFPGADFGVAGNGNGDRNCDGVLDKRARIVTRPNVVEQVPASPAWFCDLRPWDDVPPCTCFRKESTMGTPTAPPCAKTPAEAVRVLWMYFVPTAEGGVSDTCTYAVTFATGSIDYYEVLPTCR